MSNTYSIKISRHKRFRYHLIDTFYFISYSF
nr:MAG TPA_asm: hypothetical protein [Bacteriophage sp.]